MLWWIAVSSPVYFCQQWSHRWNTTVSWWQNNHMSRGEWQSNTQDELKVWACEEGSNYSELVILDDTVSCSCKNDDLLPNNFSLITREAGDKGPTNLPHYPAFQSDLGRLLTRAAHVICDPWDHHFCHMTSANGEKNDSFRDIQRVFLSSSIILSKSLFCWLHPVTEREECVSLCICVILRSPHKGESSFQF